MKTNPNPSAPTSFEVLRKFRLIYGSVRQHFREVERSCGVSGSQIWILKEINKSPGIGVSELAARLSVHQSTCSQLLEKLVARGMVVKTRSQKDQRCVGLTLTPSAAGLLVRAPGPAEGLLPEALEAMSESGRTRLDAALTELIQQLEGADMGMADKPLADM